MLSLLSCPYNEGKGLDRLLNQLKDYVDEIIIVIDKENATKEVERIARKYTDKVYRESFNDDFAKFINNAKNKTTGEWILYLTPNEFLDSYALQELKLRKFMSLSSDAYVFRRKNFELDDNFKPTLFAKYPDFQFRLYRRHCYLEGRVHERPMGYKELGIFPGHIIHDRLLESKEDKIRKMKLYQRLRRLKLQEEGRI